MEDHKFNHEADKVYDALGLTEDQFDEIQFKVMQILKRNLDGKQSENIQACVKWANEKFTDPTVSSIACIIMGEALEKARMLSTVHSMMKDRMGGGDLLDSLRKKFKESGDTEAVSFEDESKMEAFMKEFHALTAEYGGEEVDMSSDDKGMIAIKLEEGDKEEFHHKLSLLKKKYGVTSDTTEGTMMPFGGPMTEA